MAYRLHGAKPLSKPMLEYCWNIVNWTPKNKLQGNINRNFNIFIQENAFESVVCEMAAISSRPQCVNQQPENLNKLNIATEDKWWIITNVYTAVSKKNAN